MTRKAPRKPSPLISIIIKPYHSVFIKLSPQRYFLVGVAGLEPAASWSRTMRDTKLRHTPMQCLMSILNHFHLYCKNFFSKELLRNKLRKIAVVFLPSGGAEKPQECYGSMILAKTLKRLLRKTTICRWDSCDILLLKVIKNHKQH